MGDALPSWRPPHREDAPRVAERYTLLGSLGAGGTATVHRARDEVTGQVVALKQLTAAGMDKRGALLRALFEREYQTLVRLKHPRVIEAYEYGLSANGPYYTMELLDGADLQQQSPLPAAKACRYLRDIASSLALMHAQRLLHRDITPRNVRVTPDGHCKLIDFGAIAGFGPATDLVATPAYSAPEVMHRLSLDQRSDLFALGALGYFALTGRHVFGAQRLEDLELLWRTPPVPPSKLVPGVSPGLDSLILALLSIDPLSRPASAAVVIDLLSSLADLPPEDELAAESYLVSGRIVARTRELALAEQSIQQALAGRGAAIVIEGALGTGKTRLLYELALQAQLRGMLVLEADGQAAAGNFGLISVFALQLLAVCPELARSAAQPYAAFLGHLRPELSEKLGAPALAPLPSDRSERFAVLQRALHGWFEAVAEHRPLLLAADNLQAADERSAAFLAAMSGSAHELPVIVLGTLRSGDALTAALHCKQLCKRSELVKLASLDLDGCEELVKSLFGAVPNTGRVARALFEHSAGNPQHCMDLARLLVQRKLAKYAAGMWVLPLQAAREALPSRMDEIVAARLAELSADARELVEALSIYSRPVALERCLQSSERVTGARALAALAELVAAQILRVEADRYRFVQPSVGATVLARLDAASKRARHLRAADTLLLGDGAEAGLDVRMQAGWHFLRGGEERRGADMLAESARGYLTGGHATESVDEVVTALIAVFEAYERQDRSEHELAELLLSLVPLSYFGTDWRITTRYAKRAAALALRLTGLGAAQALQPLLGAQLALQLGGALAQLLAADAKRRGPVSDPNKLLVQFAALQPTALGTFCVCIDVASAHGLERTFEALDLLPRTPLLQMFAHWRRAMVYTLVGREREAIIEYEAVRQQLEDPKIAALVGEGRCKSMRGGSSYSRGLLQAYCASPRALEVAHEIDQLGMHIWTVNAIQIRRLHHANRGEIALAKRWHEQLEQVATQGGTTWQSELFWPAVMLDPDMLSGDTVGTRTIWEQLTHQAEHVPTLRVYADAAHAAYLTLRGELERAISLYEQLLPELPPRDAMSWLQTRVYFAQALSLSGQHARAKRVLHEALGHTHPDDVVVAMHFCEAHRQLALAEAGLGNPERAQSMLDALLERYAELQNPLLLGLIHKARAEIALRFADRTRCVAELVRMHEYFRATDNPALIAQWEQLNERAATHFGVHSLEPVSTDLLEPGQVADALRLTLARARASRGYMYLWQAGEMRRVEAVGGNEPPAAVEAALLLSIVALAEAEALDEAAMTVASLTDPPANTQEHGYQHIVLSTQTNGQRTVIGGVIVEMQASELYRLDLAFRAALADALSSAPTRQSASKSAS